jgi:hypothetical protein
VAVVAIDDGHDGGKVRQYHT